MGIKRIFATTATFIVVLTTMNASAIIEEQDDAIYSPAKSIASLGDSITQAANSCGDMIECPELSWSTGTDPEIDSFLNRLKALSGTEDEISYYNNARSNTTVSGLIDQAQLTVTQKAEFITILSGANDACTYKSEDMTTVDSFRSSIKSTLQTLNRGLPRSKIFIASIPDVYNLWEIGTEDPIVTETWKVNKTCYSLLAKAQSQEQMDIDRRLSIKSQIEAYNKILGEECASAKNCLYDKGSLYQLEFEINEISEYDYFHPSAAGQKRIAATEWSSTVAKHAQILRGSKKSSSLDAPIVIIDDPINNQVVSGVSYRPVIIIDSQYEIERVYADTQLGSIDLYYDENLSAWTLDLDTTKAPDGVTTSFSVIAVDSEGNVGVSNKVTVRVDNSRSVNPIETPLPTETPLNEKN